MQITRIKPGGWTIILLLLAAIIYGARSCGKLFHPGQTAAGGSGPAAGGLTTAQAANGDILVSTTKTKQQWMQAEIDKFNGQSQDGKVSLQLAESRDAMHGILDGKMQPVLWSPSSPGLGVSACQCLARRARRGADCRHQQFAVLPSSVQKPAGLSDYQRKSRVSAATLDRPEPVECRAAFVLGQKKDAVGGISFCLCRPAERQQRDADHGPDHHGLYTVARRQRPGRGGRLPRNSPLTSRQVNRAFVRDPSATGSSALEKAYTANPQLPRLHHGL